MPVFINNVDDYLGPSQACVNPLFEAPSKPTDGNAKVANRGDIDNKDISKSTNGSTLIVAENSVGTATQNDVRSKRRIRQRRAPRIAIQTEDKIDGPTSTQPSSNTTTSKDPIRLVTNEHDKTTLDNTIQNEMPSISNAPIATTQKIKKKATVTLSDCLSCSGCVTSAEAVLLETHSIDKLREIVQSTSLTAATSISNNGKGQEKKRIVFTISSASLADLYRHLYLEPRGDNSESDEQPPSRHEFLSKLADFLHSEFNAEMLVDGVVSQRISLMESASEFCYRYRQTRESSCGEAEIKTNAVPMPSVAVSSTKTRFINKQSEGGTIMDEDTLMEVTTLSHPPGRIIEEDDFSNTPVSNSTPIPELISPIQSTALPVLASSCPGFVCLAEKTAPAVVPLLSSAKSPMAVAGTLLKTADLTSSSSMVNVNNRSCYHVAIMPCHDKKLEAGRGDFTWEQQALLQYGNASSNSVNTNIQSPVEMGNDNSDEDLVNEVDLVLTTGELLEVLAEAAEKQNGGGASTVDGEQTNTLESSDSSISSINNFLGKLEHGSCTTTTAKSDKWNINQEHSNGAEDSSNLEADTGVHGSGSYADFIFRHAAKELFGCMLATDRPLAWKSSSATYASTSTAPGKATSGVIRRRRRRQDTTDLREITLYEHGDGSYSCDDKTSGDVDQPSKAVLRFATAYGFKNVQLILQSLSKTESRKSSNGYDYVEIMACPSGCSNGGGQIGSQGKRETPRETKERVKKTVSAVPIIRPSDKCKVMGDALCDCESQGLVNDSIMTGECFSEGARQLFHTRFHVVPKLELSTGATAGVAVSDTKW